MKRLLMGGLIIVFCGVLVPKCVVADEESEADIKKGELQQQIEQQTFHSQHNTNHHYGSYWPPQQELQILYFTATLNG